ncbi:hypothetical protein ACFLZZ_01050 [Nanoarchaeota archaeon]
MRILEGEEEQEAKGFMQQAAGMAENSSCLRSQCGSVIAKNGRVIGRGFNSPPRNKEPKECLKDKLPQDFVSDKTCCIHAEDRAIRDGLKYFINSLEGSRLYFIRLKEGKITKAGDPYCTWCSKMALDAGVSEFALWHDKGITVYDTKEYNDLSFKYRKK